MTLGWQLDRAVNDLRTRGEGEIADAHKHCANHRDEIEASIVAGCFYCRQSFPPSEIEDWVDDDQCAMCPKCGIDSVIGSASGYPVADPDFLRRMNDFWFGSSYK
jgi:hypothetical protein